MKLRTYQVWAETPDGRSVAYRATLSEEAYQEEHVRTHTEELVRVRLHQTAPGAAIQIAEWVQEEIPEGGE